MEEPNNPKRFEWIYDKDSRYKSPHLTSRNSGIREELEWIKRQLEYASFAEKCKTRYDLKKGEIYEVDWGVNVNAEFSSRHYGVVVADSGPFNPLVMICPLKTNHQGAHPKSDIDLGFIPNLHTGHPTVAVVNQIRTIDKLRIFTRNAIGVSEINCVADCENLDINPKTDCGVMRLSDEKLQRIINAYICMVVGE